MKGQSRRLHPLQLLTCMSKSMETGSGVRRGRLELVVVVGGVVGMAAEVEALLGLRRPSLSIEPGDDAGMSG